MLVFFLIFFFEPFPNGCFPFFGTKLIELMRIFKDVLLFWSFKYFQAHFSSHFKHIPALLAFLSMSRIVKNFLACSIICLQFFALSIIFKHFWHFLHVWHFLIFLARLSFWVLLRLARTNNHSFQHFEPKCTWVDGTDIFDQLDYRITFILLISCFHIKGRYHYVVNCPTRWSLSFIFVFLCWSSNKYQKYKSV